ncbi:MAG: RagB/SusD family nutrient uptake outer membrane protein [Muribaculaceae bacterium]|nr:RagB/SusD family nutrient uptake outer membrane protein [Muribaculaceae bacterium]
MKHNKFIIGAAVAIAATPILSSCSSDYLDQPPITTVSDDAVGQSVEAARAALYGLCQAMYCGFYREISDRNNSGEAWFQTYYGDAGSPDFWDSWLWGYQTNMQNWALMGNSNVYASINGWMYGYNLIGQANAILDKIDNIQGADEEVAFIKAQCKTMRAHGYIRLMQVYGPRFEDSKNGEALTAILREHSGTEALPLVSYKTIIDFIYKDLDEAIALYESTPVRRTFGYEPTIDVARGLYSRIALLNHDWDKAAEMARTARADYPIMSREEYKAGFANHNQEWLWYNDPDNTYIGYFSWGASYSSNGAYVTAYNWAGAGCISIYLYDEIYNRNNDDVRCELFWTPDKANKYVDFKFSRDDFWSVDYVNNEFGYMYGTAKDGCDEKMAAAVALFVRNNLPAGDWGTPPYGVDVSIDETIAKSSIRRRQWFNGLPDNVVAGVQFGAQVKFLSYEGILCGSEHSWLRGSELLLTEAEAEYERGNSARAAQLLEELNKQRINSSYTCNLTGEELRDEIRLYRRIELWGEGDTWFSFKRWNQGIKRVAWEKNNPSSDTFLINYAGQWDATFQHGWRYVIPSGETNYNPEVAAQIKDMYE